MLFRFILEKAAFVAQEHFADALAVAVCKIQHSNGWRGDTSSIIIIWRNNIVSYDTY